MVIIVEIITVTSMVIIMETITEMETEIMMEIIMVTAMVVTTENLEKMKFIEFVIKIKILIKFMNNLSIIYF